MEMIAENVNKLLQVANMAASAAEIQRVTAEVIQTVDELAEKYKRYRNRSGF